MASPASSGAFPFFSLLPSELRRRIWEESLPPRAVHFPHVPLEDRMALWEREICDGSSAPRPKSDTGSLSVLGASYESYHTLNRLYKELFGFRIPEMDEDFMLRGYDVQWMRVYRGVRFNPKIDTLCISTDFCNTMIKYGKVALEPLRFVSVHLADMFVRDGGNVGVELEFPSIMCLFLNAPNLESICLVLGFPEYRLERESFSFPSYYAINVEGALRDYWDTWRDTRGMDMYSQDDKGRAQAWRDRERWRKTVSVSF
ncbi:hypothetical protein VTL71DRAFT_4739 [Oculimacula yallundae]|uniref:2EXR domain-containing protein n=1 Tax=Oculimacula yallundae TaxID=86028 RepID=A0ABR4C2U0_9HELO